MKLLYIEDSEINANAMRRIVVQLGHEIWLAATAQAGLILLHHEPNVILLDIWLPDADGLKFVGVLHEHGIAVPIIAVTAYTMEGERENCLNAGFDDYIAKPFKFDIIATLIKKYSLS